MAHLMHNRRQAFKVRLVLWGSWAAAVACLVWGWDLLHSYGLAPGDGGELRALPERIRMALLIGLMGVVPAAAMTLFAHRYVIRLALDPTHLHITVLGWGGREGRTHTVRRHEITGSRRHHGRMDAGRSMVNAPWVSLRVGRRWIPFVLDLQAEQLNLGHLTAVMTESGGTP